mmetsp:Transcript_44249/g.117274  ORF Transcript_44249/g.117274 Transcript_44249/m.117274 type:complete len:218 (+) Transcript_44249:50-703(+)
MIADLAPLFRIFTQSCYRCCVARCEPGGDFRESGIFCIASATHCTHRPKEFTTNCWIFTGPQAPQPASPAGFEARWALLRWAVWHWFPLLAPMGGVRRSRLCLCDVWTSSRSTLQSDQDGSGSSQQQAMSNVCTTGWALFFIASPLEACGGGFVAFASLVVARWSQEPPASTFFLRPLMTHVMVHCGGWGVCRARSGRFSNTLCADLARLTCNTCTL